MATDLPTRADLFQLGRDSIVTSRPKISVDQVNTLGSDVNIVVGMTSVLAFHVAQHLAYRVSALYLDSAEGDDLDRLVVDRYRLPRKGASPAVVPVRIYRQAAGGAGSVAIGTKLRALTGVEYRTLGTATFSTSTQSVTVNAIANQAGVGSKVGKNALTRFSDPSSLFDTTLQVTNDVASAGGEAREEDDDYRERARQFWLTARRGTIGAIEQGAKTVDGVVSANAVEVLGLGGSGFPARVVQLFIADSAGLSNTTLGAQVSDRLLEYRAAGIPVLVQVGQPQIATVRVRLAFRASVETDALTGAILAAIVEYVNSLGVNEPLTLAGLSTVLQRYANDGLVVNQSAIVEPVGDLVPDAGRTIRTTPTYVTAS